VKRRHFGVHFGLLTDDDGAAEGSTREYFSVVGWVDGRSLFWVVFVGGWRCLPWRVTIMVV